MGGPRVEETEAARRRSNQLLGGILLVAGICIKHDHASLDGLQHALAATTN
jgi:hypothetical protein